MPGVLAKQIGIVLRVARRARGLTLRSDHELGYIQTLLAREL